MAEDHTVLREGLRLLLGDESDFEVVGDVADGRSVVKACQEAHPDVVVMDITMPKLNGIEATRQIVAELWKPRVVCLSAHSDRHYIEAAFNAGASAYLLKSCATEELIRAIRVVVAGKKYISSDVADIVIDAFAASGVSQNTNAYTKLSAREREVLQLLAEGRSAKEVAGTLSLSVKTINTHRTNLMQKLNIYTIAELTKYAILEGITSL